MNSLYKGAINVARCKFCKTVRRKAKGESWLKMMCKDCYRITDHFSWDARREIESYAYAIDLNKPTTNE